MAGCAHAGLNMTGATVNLPAVFIVALMSTILVIGIKESAKVNNLIVILKVAIVLLIVGVGLGHINTANWTPLMPPNTGEWGTFGPSGILRAAGLVFFAYIGFDAVSTAAQEAKNPQRDMPIGILGSLAICTFLYVIVSAVLTGIVHYTQLGGNAPVADAMRMIGAPEWIRILIDVGAVLGLASVIMVMLLGQSRVFYSMSRDGLIGKWGAAVHPKFRTPYLSTIFTGVAVGLATGVLPLQLLGQLVNIGTLLAFVLVCAGVWILRSTRPDLDRPFKTPLMPFVPIMGILCCFGLMMTLPGRHLAAPDRLADHRLRDLLRLRQAEQRAAEADRRRHAPALTDDGGSAGTRPLRPGRAGPAGTRRTRAAGSPVRSRSPMTATERAPASSTRRARSSVIPPIATIGSSVFDAA